MTISYLGPAGSFTEQACMKYSAEAFRKPCKSVKEALMELQSGQCQKCIVPIENSTEGIVNTTIDSIIFDHDFFIENMIILPITQNLLVKKGAISEDIELIISHPQGLAQCEKYLSRYYKDARQQAASSTSEAARIAAQSDGHVGAIASEINAVIYGLDILAVAIQDSGSNQTGFVVVSKEKKEIDNSSDYVSLAFSTDNRPGHLYRILNIFAIWDINITKIFSRPMKNSPGSYAFYLDVVNSSPDDLTDAIAMIKRKVSFFKYLGAYSVLDLTK